MAECSYARCVQQRRNIRRELQRWTKNMVHIVGLERIAEELMGRRKWKLYQESMSRSYLQPLNNNINRTNPDLEEFHKNLTLSSSAAAAATNNNKQYNNSPAAEEASIDSKTAILTSTTTTTTAAAVAAAVAEGAASGGGAGVGGEAGDSNATTPLDISQKPTALSPPPAAVTVKTEVEEKDIAEGGKDGKEGAPTPLWDADEQDKLKDWSPQKKCYFCVDGKLDSEQNNSHGVLSPRQTDSDSSDSHSDSEAPPSLTPAANLLNNHHHHQQHSHPQKTTLHHSLPGMTALESTSIATLAAVAALAGGTSPVAPPPPLPFYPPSLINPNYLYLANMAARSLQQQQQQHQQQQAGTDDKAVSGEQPLDLSKGSAGSAASAADRLRNNVNVRLPTLDNKHIFKAKPRMSPGTGRRTYTEDELQAALRDIQSGKLGTRRAAVIYGIPRSTLRNKVYKLTSERKQESHLASTAPLKIEEEVMDEDKELSGAEEEKEIEKTLQGPLLTMDDIVSNMENADVLRSVLQRSKEGSREFGEILQNFLLASQSILASQKTPEASALVTQMLPEILRRTMTEEQLFKLQHNGDSEKLRPSPSNSVVAKSEKSKSESDMEAEESSSNVILKIPSFRPSSKNGYDPFARSSVETTSSSIVSPPVSASESGSPPILPTGKSYKDVKDAIAQSITQKFQQGLEPRRPIIELDYKRSGYTPPLAAGGISVIKAQDSRQFQQQQQQHKLHQQQQQQNSSSSSSSAAGGKGTRPKRGKYRNYDRDSLVEAVRAVQRGEMSVHRAGSYYGVPHSTLEYKVKERHLMRPRKRDPKPNPVDEKIASLKQNDLRNSQEKMKPVIQAPKKFPPTSPNGMKLPFLEPGMAPLAGYNASPFPFWTHPGFPPIALDYGRNPSSFPNPNSEYFASQMMQKMQEDSSRTQSGSTTPTPLAKNTRHIAESLLDGTGSNGSFLDGIIRSSLESGVPTNEEKSPKEDRNLAPENMSNKALLDQLCRNSRLTPLSKAASTDASSGDESYRKNSSPINFAKGPNSQDEPMDASPCRQNDKDLPTIELSNDSNDESSSSTSDRKSSPTTTSTPATLVSSEEEKKPPLPPARIYLKPDLVNPENLKPEMLVRFREILPDLDRNGVSESVPEISASDNDMSQD